MHCGGMQHSFCGVLTDQMEIIFLWAESCICVYVYANVKQQNMFRLCFLDKSVVDAGNIQEHSLKKTTGILASVKNLINPEWFHSTKGHLDLNLFSTFPATGRIMNGN